MGDIGAVDERWPKRQRGCTMDSDRAAAASMLQRTISGVFGRRLFATDDYRVGSLSLGFDTLSPALSDNLCRPTLGRRLSPRRLAGPLGVAVGQ